MTSQIPQYIRDIILLSRRVNGAHALSAGIDAALTFIESLPNRPFACSLEALMHEQQYLLHGFRATVLFPSRVGGKLGPICDRDYHANLLGYFLDKNVEKAVKYLSSGEGSPDVYPLISAELLAFLEVFPEAMDRLDVGDKGQGRENYEWWCDRSFFEGKLKGLGVEVWQASNDERKAFYRALV